MIKFGASLRFTNPDLGFEDPAMEMAAKTWKGTNWWEFGGGGTVWNSIVYDPDFNNVYSRSWKWISMDKRY